MALEIGVLGGLAVLMIEILLRMGVVNGRPPVNFAMAVMFAGLFIFGLAALREKPMRRGNGLPSLAGIWWPALVIQAYLFPQFTRGLGPEFLAWQSYVLFAAMSFSLAWLGYALQADPH